MPLGIVYGALGAVAVSSIVSGILFFATGSAPLWIVIITALLALAALGVVGRKCRAFFRVRFLQQLHQAKTPALRGIFSRTFGFTGRLGFQLRDDAERYALFIVRLDFLFRVASGIL